MLSASLNKILNIIFRLEKQRAAVQDKQKEGTAQTPQQIKAHMEQQLKQQRIALQAKRVQEAGGKVITITTSALTSSSTVLTTSSAAGMSAHIKTITVATSGSTGTPTIIKQVHVHPKTVISAAGIQGLLNKKCTL